MEPKQPELNDLPEDNKNLNPNDLDGVVGGLPPRPGSGHGETKQSGSTGSFEEVED